MAGKQFLYEEKFHDKMPSYLHSNLKKYELVTDCNIHINIEDTITQMQNTYRKLITAGPTISPQDLAFTYINLRKN